MAYSGRDISSLSDRPHEDGVSTNDLKARFDQLNKEVIPNFNDLIDLLDAYLQSNDGDITALGIAIDNLGISLGDLDLSVTEVLEAYTSGILSGVYIGATEPTDPRIKVWINPDGQGIIIDEATRVANEVLRISQENTRLANEISRVEAEDIRLTSELTRVSSEDDRFNAEAIRDSNEITRIENEDIRLTNENTRNTNEDTRISQESSRDDAEVIRLDSEIARDDAEDLRLSQESTRVSNENVRVTSENARNVFVAYNSATNYVVGNKVSYLGSSYQCILASLNNLPTNTTYWLLFAQAGEDAYPVTLDVASSNIFNKANIIIGKEVYSDGTFRSEANSAITEYIALPSNCGSVYISGLTVYVTGIDRYIWFYDENYVKIGSSTTISKTLTEKSYNVPANAKYLAFSIYQRKTSLEVVNLNSIQVDIGIKRDYSDYQQGNKTLNGLPYLLSYGNQLISKTYGKTLLTFGDSITETANISEDGATYTEGSRDNWPVIVKGNMRFGNLWNYAKSGATFKDQNVVGNIRLSISQQIQLAINNNRSGDVVVIAAGTNDGSNGVIGDYTTAMAKATLNDLDRTKLYEAVRWCFWKIRESYPSAICFAIIPIQRASTEQPEALIEAITKMAKRYNFIIIDALNESGIIREYEIIGSNGRFLYDGLHPNASGRLMISRLISAKIKNTLDY